MESSKKKKNIVLIILLLLALTIAGVVAFKLLGKSNIYEIK